MPDGTNRQTSLTIDLGDEQILLERVEAIESLGRPFVITIDLFSELGELDILPHLGKPASVAIHEDDVLLRHFHGIVVEGEYLSEQTAGFHYRLVLRPWTHLLSQNRNYAIHQDKDALAVIRETLVPYGFAHIDYAGAKAKLRKREYTVQYGESDFAFISRLLEEEGIYYYFEHAAGRHTLMLCDAPQVHSAGKPAVLTYNPTSGSVGNADSAARSDSGASKFLQRWQERVVTGAEQKVTMRDFDFEKPQRPVEVNHPEKQAHPLDALEVYQWPGNYVQEGDGKRLATMLLESRRAGRQTYSSETQLASLVAGYKFTLQDHPNDRFNTEYLVTRTHHVIATEIHRSGGSAGEHVVHFEAIRADTRWHSPITTPRPVVRGPETAIVTGPRGETIHCDKYGRVKVRFHWDRAKTEGQVSTCWIRVSQTGGLGNLILPRVGHEVVVEFLDGDPDRPLVMGRVFNGAQMPVYGLPANKTRMLWRSLTYGDQGPYAGAEALDVPAQPANEIRFEDNGGKEEFFMYASRDMNTRVRYKEAHHVGHDQDVKVGNSRKVKIRETDTLDVGKWIKVDAGTSITMTAQTSIKLICGDSSLELTPAGITVKSVMYKNSASGMSEIKAPMTTIKGDGMLILKGGMTMIN
ncbi:type VI secretion system tip protein TssI/VgrG [Sphingomonas sp. 1P06PA]|uniref:type VI secretion system Vgr family protein n=1 Tax=Sphingomonas sp. 1P06PA TaxID=554121 RepID=UPI0039A52841